MNIRTIPAILSNVIQGENNLVACAIHSTPDVSKHLFTVCEQLN